MAWKMLKVIQFLQERIEDVENYNPMFLVGSRKQLLTLQRYIGLKNDEQKKALNELQEATKKPVEKEEDFLIRKKELLKEYLIEHRGWLGAIKQYELTEQLNLDIWNGKIKRKDATAELNKTFGGLKTLREIMISDKDKEFEEMWKNIKGS
jgi:hypothetical protein